MVTKTVFPTLPAEGEIETTPVPSVLPLPEFVVDSPDPETPDEEGVPRYFLIVYG
jgi:hypothetical protein